MHGLSLGIDADALGSAVAALVLLSVKNLSTMFQASQISERNLAKARGGVSVMVVCMLRP